MEIREFICINCPLGCPLQVELEVKADGENVILVSGNTCRRGETYAKEEVTDPRRVVTSTVALTGGEQAVVSVKTEKAIPKDNIGACMKALKKITAEAPVRIGDVLVENIADTGVELVATKGVRAKTV